MITDSPVGCSAIEIDLTPHVHPHPGFLMLNSSTRYDDRRYNKGDRMIADFGACYEGYYGDVTRMTIFGEPTDDDKRIMRPLAMSSTSVSNP